MPSHAALADADGYWRQFVTNFYFDKPGDKIEGQVVKLINVRKDDPPAIEILTSGGRRFIVTAHQARLRSELVRQAPAVGEAIRITYNGEAARAAPGMSKAKEFTVAVRRPDSQSQERPDVTSGKKETSENVPGTG